MSSEPSTPTLGPAQLALLGGGCALIVAFATPDGAPFASRGWGVQVLSADPPRVRLVLDAADAERLADGPTQLAVTGADVRTLQSVQLKGRATAQGPATDADLACFERYFDQFATDVWETDGTDRWLLERLVPHAFATAELLVDEVYDQTPGPGAGASLTPGDGSS